MKNNNDIDNIFKDALDDLQESAPPAVWESLSNDLDKQQAALFREKYHRVKRLAVLLLLIIFSGSIYMFYFNTPGKKQLAQSKKDNSEKNEADQSASATDQPAAVKTSAGNKNSSKVHNAESATEHDSSTQLSTTNLADKTVAGSEISIKTAAEKNILKKNNLVPATVASVHLKKEKTN